MPSSVWVSLWAMPVVIILPKITSEKQIEIEIKNNQSPAARALPLTLALALVSLTSLLLLPMPTKQRDWLSTSTTLNPCHRPTTSLPPPPPHHHPATTTTTTIIIVCVQWPLVLSQTRGGWISMKTDTGTDCIHMSARCGQGCITFNPTRTRCSGDTPVPSCWNPLLTSPKQVLYTVLTLINA